jgi:excisionase family DNA binding protein
VAEDNIWKLFLDSFSAADRRALAAREIHGSGKNATKEFLSPKDIAETLDLSVDMVYRLIKSGELPALSFKSDQNTQRQIYRVRVKDFEDFLERSVFDPNESTEQAKEN